MERKVVKISIVWSGRKPKSREVLRDIYSSELLWPVFSIAGDTVGTMEIHLGLRCSEEEAAQGKWVKNVLYFEADSLSAAMGLCMRIIGELKQSYNVTATVEVGKDNVVLPLVVIFQEKRIRDLENAIILSVLDLELCMKRNLVRTASKRFVKIRFGLLESLHMTLFEFVDRIREVHGAGRS